MDFKKDIGPFIQSQGWAFHGIVSREPLKGFLKRHQVVFKKWIDDGSHSSMGWLSRMENDRYHPENKLPDFKSVIVLGAEYGYEQKICSKKEGVVASYAKGRDYHKVLKKRCIALSDYLKTHGECPSPGNPIETYISIDSGPTPDRVLAEAAGLGFFGKNTLLIHPERGSFFLIASLMTTLDLEETERKPMSDCGSCRRCVDVCPTGALRGDGTMDARLCISYLTIENREGIPLELRPRIGNRLFGCDICQAVCPFNRGKKQEVLIEELKGDYGVGDSLDLREVLALATEEQFIAKFAGTPLMRAKRLGLLRNASVVAGNSGNSALIPDLESVLQREVDLMIKEHAEWAIHRLQGEF